MKQKCLFLILCVFQVHISIGQISVSEKETLKKNYLDGARILQKSYETKSPKIVSSYTYKYLFSNLFSNIISSSNITRNYTAASFSFVKDKATLAVNFAKYNDKKTIFNLGFLFETSSGTFNIYSKNNWNNGMSITMGGSSFTKSKLFFSENEFEKISKKRKLLITQTLKNYYNVIDIVVLQDSINRLYNKYLIDSLNVAQLDTLFKKTPKFLDTLHLMDSVFKKYEILSFKNITEERKKSYTLSNQNNLYAQNIEYDISKFELDNSKDLGYSLHWIGYNATLGISNTKIYSDTLTKDSLFVFKPENYFRARFNLGYNYIRKRTFLNYVSLGVSLFNTTFLENRFIKEIPFISYNDVSKKYEIYTDPKNSLGSLEDATKNIWIFNPGCSWIVFPKPDGVLGFQASTNVKFAIGKPTGISYPNSFDAYLGLILRLADENNVSSNGLISLEGGLYNAEFGTKVWYNAFAFRIKIGIPIISFLKKTDKK